MSTDAKHAGNTEANKVTAAAVAAAAEIGGMRRKGEEICDVAHIESAMRAATGAKHQD